MNQKIFVKLIFLILFLSTFQMEMQTKTLNYGANYASFCNLLTITLFSTNFLMKLALNISCKSSIQPVYLKYIIRNKVTLS